MEKFRQNMRHSAKLVGKKVSRSVGRLKKRPISPSNREFSTKQPAIHASRQTIALGVAQRAAKLLAKLGAQGRLIK